MLLSLKEVAQQLRMPAETVRRWVLQGKIPMQVNRGDYTIRQEVLRRWADEHHLKIYGESAVRDMGPDEPAFDGIVPAMQRGGVFYDVPGETKAGVLQSAVLHIPNVAASEQDRLYAKLMEREQLASTGIGHGFAMPHPRANPGLGLALPQISTCFLLRPVDFSAIDQQPVAVLIVLLSESTQVHLAMMSKLSFYLRDRTFREFVMGVPKQDQLLKRLADLESAAS